MPSSPVRCIINSYTSSPVKVLGIISYNQSFQKSRNWRENGNNMGEKSICIPCVTDTQVCTYINTSLCLYILNYATVHCTPLRSCMVCLPVSTISLWFTRLLNEEVPLCKTQTNVLYVLGGVFYLHIIKHAALTSGKIQGYVIEVIVAIL